MVAALPVGALSSVFATIPSSSAKVGAAVRGQPAIKFSWVVVALLLVFGGIAFPTPSQAQSECTAPGSTTGYDCTDIIVGDWSYLVVPGYGYTNLGPFKSEAEAVAALAARMTQGTGWCTATPASVTYNDNTTWGATSYSSGNIDLMHGNTIHLNITAYTNNNCIQSWVYHGALRQSRELSCLTGFSVRYPNGNTSLTPYCRRARTGVSYTKSWGSCPVTGARTDMDKGLWFGNPCEVANGNKHQREADYLPAAGQGVSFVRHYNSGAAQTHSLTVDQLWEPLGSGWMATYFQRLYVSPAGPFGTVIAHRPDGKILTFNASGTDFISDADATDRLSAVRDSFGNITGWIYRTANETRETYDAAGRLQSLKQRGTPEVTLTYDTYGRIPVSASDADGHAIQFAYQVDTYKKKRLTQVTDPSGGVVQYSYNTAGNLTSALYQDGRSRTYGYTAPGKLTSLIDESGTTLSTWTYAYIGELADVVTGSSRAGGVGQYTFSYSGANRTVVDPLAKSRVYGTTLKEGVRRVVSAPSTCPTCGTDKALTYDANGNVTIRKDFNNVETRYTYDTARNLETSRTEAYGTARARTIATTWHSTLRLPTLIAEANRSTALTYDSAGNMLTRTVTDTSVTPNVARTWTYTYDAHGRTLTVDGPRTDVSDVTTIAYYSCTAGYQCGQISTVTDALGHITTYNTYNAHGLPLTITDANSVVTTLTYDARQRLTSRTVGSETTTFDYWSTGLLKKVTLPDYSFLSYTYDAAQRLTRIDDTDGNYVVYTLDAMGNRTAESAYDPSSALSRTQTRVFNTLGQLWKEVGAAGTVAVTTQLAYDSNGNQTTTSAPLSRNSVNGYDELNRLSQITDPGTGVTTFSYDANDNLVSVLDPRSLLTSYTYSGFGDLLTQTSPDTGATTNTYDSGGNVQTSTNARGAVSTYAYDALNRVASVEFKIGTTIDQTINYTYDSGTNGVGRLAGATDANHSLTYTYDSLGRITGKGQTVTGTAKTLTYGYSSGNLTSLVTPSGQTLTYGYTSGRPTSIAVNGTTLLSGVLYEPMGPVRQWTWGNSTLAVRSHDQDGRVTQIDSSEFLTYAYDDASRITTLTNTGNSALSWAYGYDALDRLTSGSRTGLSQTWTYDANGNRLTQGGTTSTTFTNSGTSNRLSSTSGALARSYGYDATGNSTSYSGLTFTYNYAGRMTGVSGGASASYLHNALGQRVKKVTGGNTTYFVYDEAGHLIGEYDGSGNLIQETVWLGAIPVATLRPNGGSVAIYYVHTDHLNTPRRISRPSDNVIVWRWDSDPFGTTAASQDPDGDSTNFVYNLRFPGQYYDAETGLNYNYFRDYDSQTGRYVESDPIGLEAGVNTFLYVGANPVQFFDPEGLLCTYSQGTGNLTCKDDMGRVYLICQGYAGTGVGRDNPDAQIIRNIGPIPRGDYIVGEPFRHPRTGPITRRLIPFASNDMGNRSGFMMHGNNAENDASNGCIVAPRQCRQGIPAGETLKVTK